MEKRKFSDPRCLTWILPRNWCELGCLNNYRALLARPVIIIGRLSVSSLRRDYRNVGRFAKQQQQQHRSRLPYLWIFSAFRSLFYGLPLSFSLFYARRILEGSRKASWRVGNCAGWHTRSRKRLRR